MNKDLFRGKLKNNNEWCYWNVYGELVTINGKRTNYTITKGAKVSYYHHIYQLKQFIIPETIGQYTFSNAANNKRIFKGDIIRGVDNKLRSVRWNFETLSWELTDVEVPDNEVNHFLNTYPLGEIQLESCYGEMISEIVGNIHDNPELLKGDKDNA